MNWLRRWYDERPVECGVVVWTAGMLVLAVLVIVLPLAFS